MLKHEQVNKLRKKLTCPWLPRYQFVHVQSIFCSLGICDMLLDMHFQVCTLESSDQVPANPRWQISSGQLRGYFKIHYLYHITSKRRERRRYYNFSMCYIAVGIPHHLFPFISKVFSLLLGHIWSFLKSLLSLVISWVHLFSSPHAIILYDSYVI